MSDAAAGASAGGRGQVPYGFLFAAMVREEYRLHARQFGGRRFVLFPFLIAAVSAGTTTFFALAHADATVLVAGLHIVVALVGFQVGTIGLVGRDALENLLGDVTMLIYAARTLPVSWRRLLAVFVLKDVGYYAVLFVAPLVVGLIPLAALGVLSSARLPALLVTSWLAFSFGVGVSLALVGLATRSRPVALTLALAAIGTLVAAPDAVIPYTPYGLAVDPSLATLTASVLFPVAFAVVGVTTFDTERKTPARTAGNQFRAVRGRLRARGLRDEQGVLAKSLLDVARSSGGLWKVAFSQGLVFAVVSVLLAYLPSVVPVRPSPGLTLSTVLALGSFTTYNWLCQCEDEAFYRYYPIDLDGVFRAKLRGFLLLAVPTGLVYLALGAVIFGADTVLVGALAFVPLVVYVFGVTAWLAGLSPGELLFDTTVFAAFTLAMMAVLLPLVIAAIASPLAPLVWGSAAVALSIVAGAVGLVLTDRVGSHWATKARSASYGSPTGHSHW